MVITSGRLTQLHECRDDKILPIHTLEILHAEVTASSFSEGFTTRVEVFAAL